MQPVAEFLDDRVSEHLPVEEPDKGYILRPPGALPEVEFLEACHRCGNCIKNCPANAILPLQHAQSNIANTPYIDPDEQPCVICDSLACMYVCPSGALKPVYAEDIRIGLAVFNVETCLRTKEVACTYCIDTCPDRGGCDSSDNRRRCGGVGIRMHRLWCVSVCLPNVPEVDNRCAAYVVRQYLRFGCIADYSALFRK